ncbi:reverse transcriptase, partial [Phytophthora megakarya]
KWFKQAKSTAKINNKKATLLFDSGAEVSIVDSTFAQRRTRIKITLVGAYVHYFGAWVGELSGQEAILGMAPQFREKLSILIKGLLLAKIITTSTSPWASPIVVIIKANGVDIRLCIDYQVVNSLTRMMVYTMPLINDLLEDLDKALWYCSLDMASGFWVSTRMLFGLKNAPQIYQRIVDNALYGHMRIKPDQDRSNPVDVFEEGEPEPEPKPSVLGRRSYVDDILVTGDTLDNMCNRVNKPLGVCDRWNLSISVAKSYWGRRKIAYLGHEVFSAGLGAKLKELEAIANLPRFIEDFAVYAAFLYELREAYFHEIAKMDAEETGETRTDEGQITGGERDRWASVKNAFTMLKAKIIATPVPKQFVPERTPVIMLYANKWAISAALMKEHERGYHPVTLTSRTLKANELNYGVVDKEVLSRFSTLAWLLKSNGFDGRLGS